jgi:hypothetical protein
MLFWVFNIIAKGKINFGIFGLIKATIAKGSKRS